MGQDIRGEYPPDWPAIALRVKDEAGWRCVRCSHPYDPASGAEHSRTNCDRACSHGPPDGKQRVLTVAHLDDDKSNCAPWNLAALCQVCHLETQGKIEMRQAYFLEHSDWMAWRVRAMMAERAEVVG